MLGPSGDRPGLLENFTQISWLQLAPSQLVPLFPAGRLLADPAKKFRQLRRLAELLDRRIKGGQGTIGIGRMDHAVALGTKQFHVFARAALLLRQAVVLGQLPALEGPAAQRAGNRQ